MTARISRPLAIAATAAMLTTLLGTSPVSSLEQDSLPTVDKGTVLTPAPSTEPITAPEIGPILAPLPGPPAPRPGIDRPSLGGTPKFIVEAVGFKAIDETGLDWPGSDEILVAWNSEGVHTISSEFDDVDSGEFHALSEDETCMYPMEGVDFGSNTWDSDGAWECKEGGGQGPIEFDVNIYESDDWEDLVCWGDEYDPKTNGDCEDDWLGGYTGSWSVAELTEMLESPGDYRDFTERVLPCSQGQVCSTSFFQGDYDFYFRITRMDDEPMKFKAVD